MASLRAGKRFEELERDNITGTRVLKDKRTGVLYLFYKSDARGGGVTPLLDSNGKPIIEPVKKES